MTAFQQAILHTVMLVAVVAAAVVLALTGKITGPEALAILIAAAGITGTGVAGTVSTLSSQLSSQTSTPPVQAALPPAPTPTPTPQAAPATPSAS